jgi:tungstate transport system permease protein
MTATAVESTDVRLTETVLSLGADRVQLLAATLSEARFAMALAAASAFGRIVSEVGIAMMVGGNIKWHTRTITTAIALETGKGEFATGIALGIVLMLVALVVNLLVALLRRRAGA